jgi:hypothetical protein
LIDFKYQAILESRKVKTLCQNMARSFVDGIPLAVNLVFPDGSSISEHIRKFPSISELDVRWFTSKLSV